MWRMSWLSLWLVASSVPARVAWSALATNGSVVGTVRVERLPPKTPPAKIAKDAAVCGREAMSEAMIVGPDKGVANVVVMLKGVKPGKPPAPTANAFIDQVGCRYTPHVQAVTVGTSLNLLNNDAVLHNVHGTLGPAGKQITVFNVAMPFKGQKLPTVLKRPGVIKLRCDAGHTWMSAYVHVLDHPYFAVTDAKGAFALKDVPPGKYTLEYWHEPADDKSPAILKTAEIEVVASKAIPADLTLTP
jgi:plastocyanin